MLTNVLRHWRKTSVDCMESLARSQEKCVDDVINGAGCGGSVVIDHARHAASPALTDRRGGTKCSGSTMTLIQDEADRQALVDPADRAFEKIPGIQVEIVVGLSLQ
mmetsp:Transcript_26076/g.59062  ORF Transcript_26076/g.59062 Transcript_26076/m.59062 type:complete len:106 (-) Transcript_26076:756-1073(-)